MVKLDDSNLFRGPSNEWRDIMNRKRIELADLSNLSIPEDIDLESALKRVRGNWELLRTLIVSFAINNKGLASTFQTLVQQENFEDAQRLAHQIKGASASIGAACLANLVDEIDVQIELRNHTIPPELINRIDFQLAQISNLANQIHE